MAVIEVRFHTTVVALMELEHRRPDPSAPPEELSTEGTDVTQDDLLRPA